MRIGLPIVFYSLEKGETIQRAGWITEIGDEPGKVGIAYCNRPVADIMLQRTEQFGTANSVPFFESLAIVNGHSKWCGPVLMGVVSPVKIRTGT